MYTKKDSSITNEDNSTSYMNEMNNNTGNVNMNMNMNMINLSSNLN